MVKGDHYTDGRGIPVAIDGAREMVQRALIRLCVQKGRFAEDPTLGSELYKLAKCQNSASRERLALAYVQEALLPMPQIAVQSVELKLEGESLQLLATILYQNNSYPLEVNIQ